MSHWYDPETLDRLAQVGNKSKPGELRDATLRDARPLKLYPSVTTILQELSKPALTDWLIEQAVREAFSYQLLPGIIPEDNIIKQIARKGKDIGYQKAEEGTIIHDLLESMLKGIPAIYVSTPLQNEVALVAFEWLAANGFKCEQSEVTFACKEYGYAGTIDFLGTYYDEPCIVDFKTQDSDSIKRFNIYDEWPLQLAGYDIGYPLVDIQRDGFITIQEVPRRRIEVVISRTHPGVILHHEFTDKENDDEAWLSLVKFWQAKKRYWPNREEVVLQKGLTLDV